MIRLHFGAMVPKSSILGGWGKRGVSEDMILEGLAREGILIFWCQAATVAGYLGVVVSWYWGILMPRWLLWVPG